MSNRKTIIISLFLILTASISALEVNFASSRLNGRLNDGNFDNNQIQFGDESSFNFSDSQVDGQAVVTNGSYSASGNEVNVSADFLLAATPFGNDNDFGHWDFNLAFTPETDGTLLAIISDFTPANVGNNNYLYVSGVHLRDITDNNTVVGAVDLRDGSFSTVKPPGSFGPLWTFSQWNGGSTRTLSLNVEAGHFYSFEMDILVIDEQNSTLTLNPQITGSLSLQVQDDAVVTVVPEASSFLLFGIACGILQLRKRAITCKRKKN